MVKLTDDYQAKAADFKAAGIAVPQFDQEQMKQTTEANPVWVSLRRRQSFPLLSCQDCAGLAQ